MSIPERYKFYRQWHNRFHASILAIDIVYWINGAIVIGIFAGVVLL